MTGRIITDREELREFCEKKRREGASIVFTNGVFDLVHSGHLDSLRRASSEGDFLIVAINSDESVRRIKGEGRPILPLDQRMRILSAIDVVDLVTCFDEDTSEPIIRTVKPDVLVKGGHYTIEQIVGHEFLESYGGKVLPMPIVEGCSTTNIIGTIKERFAKS